MGAVCVCVCVQNYIFRGASPSENLFPKFQPHPPPTHMKKRNYIFTGVRPRANLRYVLLSLTKPVNLFIALTLCLYIRRSLLLFKEYVQGLQFQNMARSCHRSVQLSRLCRSSPRKTSSSRSAIANLFVDV